MGRAQGLGLGTGAIGGALAAVTGAAAVPATVVFVTTMIGPWLNCVALIGLVMWAIGIRRGHRPTITVVAWTVSCWALADGLSLWLLIVGAGAVLDPLPELTPASFVAGLGTFATVSTISGGLAGWAARELSRA